MTRFGTWGRRGPQAEPAGPGHLRTEAASTGCRPGPALAGGVASHPDRAKFRGDGSGATAVVPGFQWLPVSGWRPGGWGGADPGFMGWRTGLTPAHGRPCARLLALILMVGMSVPAPGLATAQPAASPRASEEASTHPSLAGRHDLACPPWRGHGRHPEAGGSGSKAHDLLSPLCREMVWVPGGDLTMGSPASEAGRDEDEGPTRNVRIPGFFMARRELGLAMWVAVMGGRPERMARCRGACPVSGVSWLDAQRFIERLRWKTGLPWRLPSEAEWEWAARAGCARAFQVGQAGCMDAPPPGAVVHDENRLGRAAPEGPRPSGGRPGNRWGLEDLHGNLAEWVQDCWGELAELPADGRALERARCRYRAMRGGSWFAVTAAVRAASRNYFEPGFRDPTFGFRLVLDRIEPGAQRDIIGEP